MNETPLILVVDDDPLLQRAAARVLDQAGYRTGLAADGLGALQMVHDQKPELTLLDVNLPGMSGIEVCSLIKADPALKGCFVILLSGMRIDSQSKVEGLDSGADGYIVRPVTNEELLARVRGMLRIQQSEKELREARLRLEGIVEGTHAGIWEWNVQTGEATINEVWAQIIGYSLADLAPFNIQAWKMLTHPDDRERSAELLERHFSGELPNYNVEYRMRHRDGRWVWVHDRGRVITRTDDGKPLMMYGSHTDLTERKELTEKIIRYQKMAGLGTLAAGMAHEINSPLQVITGASEILLAKLEEENLDREGLMRRVQHIHDNAWRVGKIVASLLDYARSSQGSLAAASLNTVVQDALRLVEHQNQAGSKIEVVTELGENLPDLTCDRNQIILVLINLLNNARDAMPQGGKVTLRTGFDPGSQRLSLAVGDEGEGISEDAIRMVFDPFFTNKPHGHGSGLGLSIVQGIVRSHGGEISVESQVGVGSTFTVHLPIVPILEENPLENILGRYHRSEAGGQESAG